MGTIRTVAMQTVFIAVACACCLAAGCAKVAPLTKIPPLMDENLAYVGRPLPKAELPTVPPDPPDAQAAPFKVVLCCRIFAMTPDFAEKVGIDGLVWGTMTKDEANALLVKIKNSEEATTVTSPAFTAVSGKTQGITHSAQAMYVGGYVKEGNFYVPKMDTYDAEVIAVRAQPTVEGEAIVLRHMAALTAHTQLAHMSAEFRFPPAKKGIRLNWSEPVMTKYMGHPQGDLRLKPSEVAVFPLAGTLERGYSNLSILASDVREEKPLDYSRYEKRVVYALVRIEAILPAEKPDAPPPGNE